MYSQRFLLLVCIILSFAYTASDASDPDHNDDGLTLGITVHSSMDDVKALAKKRQWNIYKIEGNDLYIRDEKPQFGVVMYIFTRFKENVPAYVSLSTTFQVKDNTSEELWKKIQEMTLSKLEDDLMKKHKARKIKSTDDELIIEYTTTNTRTVRFRMDKSKWKKGELFAEYFVWS